MINSDSLLLEKISLLPMLVLLPIFLNDVTNGETNIS